MLENVDICVGLAWGDEAKGKIVSSLSQSDTYDIVCRWAGGSNAGHTIWIQNRKYITHLVPCGILFNKLSIIGPDCVLHIPSFFNEIKYLRENGFDTSKVKVSPSCHIVSDDHIYEDTQKESNALGTTSQGIRQCYRDKYARIGTRAIDCPELHSYLWDGKLHGNVLCEGAQGFWLDINCGNYPYVTSSTTLPYGACSLGFSPKKIRTIYGAAKMYDTRSGVDPDFPESLLQDEELKSIATLGEEYGNTTGRPRIVNWLNMNKLVKAINQSGTTMVIMSKGDVLEAVGVYRVFSVYAQKLISFPNMVSMKKYIESELKGYCLDLTHVIFSESAKLMSISQMR